jgi:hypothetical protein
MPEPHQDADDIRAVECDPRTGLPIVHLGRPVTDDDVAALEDD